MLQRQNRLAVSCTVSGRSSHDVLTCRGYDALAALATEAREQAGLPRARQPNADHIVLWSRWRGSFTAQCPETLKPKAGSLRYALQVNG